MGRLPPMLLRAPVRVRSSAGRPWGTAFGYPRPDAYNTSDPTVHSSRDAQQWRLWFVTCAHVVDAIEASSGTDQRVSVEVNETSGGLTKIAYPIGHFWTRHREWVDRCWRLGPIATRDYTVDDAAVDVAVTTAPTHYDHWDDLAWGVFPPSTHITKARMNSETPLGPPVSEGDRLFVLGFPVGFYEDAMNWPTVRHGMVAQLQPYLAGEARTFLIDGSVFGGNSGGPVVTSPTRQLETPSLIGMVSGCRLDPSTQQNADLGIVVPLDTINETIEMALSDSPHVSRLPGSG